MAPTTNHNTKNFETILKTFTQAIIGTLKQYISLNESAKRWKGKEVKTTTDNSNQTANLDCFVWNCQVPEESAYLSPLLDLKKLVSQD